MQRNGVCPWDCQVKTLRERSVGSLERQLEVVSRKERGLLQPTSDGIAALNFYAGASSVMARNRGPIERSAILRSYVA